MNRSYLIILFIFQFFLPVLILSQTVNNEDNIKIFNDGYRKHAMINNGKPELGKKLFAGNRALCSQCHTVDGSNNLAGPDLSAAGDKFSRADLIFSVINPSANIMTGFSLLTVTTKDNEVFSGTVKESSETKLVIAGAGNVRHQIPKEKIKKQLTSELSMMPPNLHLSLTKDEFTNLIAYLESLKSKDSMNLNKNGSPLEIKKLERPISTEIFFGKNIDLEKPVWFGEHPSLPDIFLVLEKSRARISLIKKSPAGKEAKKTFVELRKEVYVTNDEGLLGLAFHPDFTKNRKYYFMHEVKDGTRRGMVVGEREANKNLIIDSGKPTRKILDFDVATQFHHGGCLEFGPDGYLYVGVGDGGPQEDPHGHAQNLKSFSGKILRIDVNSSNDSMLYKIPNDNPFINHPKLKVHHEIFAYGFRQPWRFSFDSKNGDLWVGDVGQNRFEEISIVRSGENHGWNVFEGFELFSTEYMQKKKEIQYTLPVVSFHRKHGVSITGGYVLNSHPDHHKSFNGVYICADYQSKRIWGIKHKDRKLNMIREIGVSPDRVVSFGRDSRGGVYTVGYDRGIIYKLNFKETIFK